MKLIFVTHNKHKLIEVAALMPERIELLSLNDINCKDEIKETGLTLEENALLKARYVQRKYHCNCFADDTGLEVEALDGRPGVYSARYAGEKATYNDNAEKLLNVLLGEENRNARFRTVIALLFNGDVHIFEGVINGTITIEKRGEGGFGYDPIFLPNGLDRTFAELDLGEKNKISHRAIALNKLINHLNKIVDM